jgi:hypothetical protein
VINSLSFLFFTLEKRKQNHGINKYAQNSVATRRVDSFEAVAGVSNQSSVKMVLSAVYEHQHAPTGHCRRITASSEKDAALCAGSFWSWEWRTNNFYPNRKHTQPGCSQVLTEPPDRPAEYEHSIYRVSKPAIYDFSATPFAFGCEAHEH